MKNADKVLKEAREIARSVETWADLCNALFNPVDGVLTSAFPTPSERAKFVKTEQYKKIQDLIETAIESTGLVEGATPKKSGRFVVRLPQSLHVALEQEAKQEGVSLNQLVVAKLAAQLRTITQPARPPRRRVRA
jgi:predicted HicB family RNase H-like nuclease